MTTFLLSFGFFLLGCAATGVAVGALARRWLQRFRQSELLLATQHDLEKRRVAHDLGRNHKTRPQAGPAARIVQAMPAHTAKVTWLQTRRQTTPKKPDSAG